MRELRDIWERARELRAADRPDAIAAIATIVAVEGSSYRREGARMLLEPDGTLTGVLSGGCIERDLLETAKRALDENRPRTATFDLLADEEAIWGFGLGCAGKIRLLVEPLAGPAGDALAAALPAALDERKEVLIATRIRPTELGDESVEVSRSVAVSPGPAGGRTETSIEGQGETPEDPAAGPAIAGDRPAFPLQWRAFPDGAGQPQDAGPLAPEPRLNRKIFPPGVARGTASGANGWLLLESILPPVHLALIGSERDSLALLRQARELGWTATVVDPRPTEAAAARVAGWARYVAGPPRRLAESVPLDARTAVLVATHRYLDDLAYLGEARGLAARLSRRARAAPAEGPAARRSREAGAEPGVRRPGAATRPGRFRARRPFARRGRARRRRGDPGRDVGPPRRPTLGRAGSRRGAGRLRPFRVVLRVAGALLAAGGSTRFGRPKALLEFRGTTFLHHLAAELAAVTSPALVVAPPDPAAGFLEEIAGTGARLVTNPDPARGMGSSIAAAARELASAAPGADALLLVLVDQPLAERGLFARLVAASQPTGWAACDYGSGVTGPPAVFPRAAFAELAGLTGDAGARAVLAPRRNLLELVAFPGGRFDVDDEADYARLLDAASQLTEGPARKVDR